MDNSIILYGAKVYSVCIVVTKTPKSSSFKHRRQLKAQFKSFGSSLNSNTQVQSSTQLMNQLTTQLMNQLTTQLMNQLTTACVT